MQRLMLAVLLLVAFAANPAQAGQVAKVHCTNPGCDYTKDLAIAGGRNSPSITGYCAGCRDFVRLKLASWNDYRGKTYKCPKGHGPFTPIYDLSQISQFPCPKCGQLTLQAKRGMMFD
ncbi:MAG: hypothetical protein NTW80_12930 [Deltaproteobacteria bacterium]|nr:hypothetical protein [Deltaproteobacteria bacterium]